MVVQECGAGNIEMMKEVYVCKLEFRCLRVAFQSSIVDLVLSKQWRNLEDEEHEWAASYRQGHVEHNNLLV